MSNHVACRRSEIWIANLNPANDSEPGKVRPVVIVQSDLLNQLNHTSTVICPISSQDRKTYGKLRIFIAATTENGLTKDSYILSDQIRAIDLNRLERKVGQLSHDLSEKLSKGIKIVLDF